MSKRRNVLRSSDAAFRMEVDTAIRRYRSAQKSACDVVAKRPLDQSTLEQYSESFARAAEDAFGWKTGALERETMSYVYLFESAGLYKVGITRDIPKRIQSLQTGNGHPIVLVDYMIVASGAITEKEIHKHFKSSRTSGEWFALSAQEVATVRGWFKNGIPTYLGD